MKLALPVLPTGQAACHGHSSHPVASHSISVQYQSCSLSSPSVVRPRPLWPVNSAWRCHCTLYGLLKPITVSLALALLEMNGQQALSQAHHAVSLCPIAHGGASNPLGFAPKEPCRVGEQAGERGHRDLLEHRLGRAQRLQRTLRVLSVERNFRDI